MFSLVMTTLILNGPKPASARLSMAPGGGERAVAPDRVVGRLASAPSIEIWMSV